jgi:UDP-N-acetylglucosamine 4,6-dehydratase
MSCNLSGKTILITGGTGSLGTALLQILLTKYAGIRQIIVYSRDELKQFEESERLATCKILKWKLGDIRDFDRLKQVCKNVDYIFHLAALKQVPACELNPDECIKTNITGTQNLIRAAHETGVTKVIAVSTDKAVTPVNTYGASKLLMEKLILSADSEQQGCQFSIVRFGNFAASRGSVIPLFLRQKHAGEKLTVTEPAMTRFCIREEDAALCLIDVLTAMKGGETYIPKMKSYRIGDIANAIAPPNQWKLSGIRVGERMHEELISRDESGIVLEAPHMLIILPYSRLDELDIYHQSYYQSIVHKNGYSYRSDLNNQWYTQGDIHEMIWGNGLQSSADRHQLIPASGSAATKTSAPKTTKSATTASEASAPVSGLSSSS